MTPAQFQKDYEKLYMPLCIYSLRILGGGDISVAEDIVHDAFEYAWKHRDTITLLRQYMYRAVHHRCISHLRNQHPTVSAEELDNLEADEALTALAERDAALWKAIDALPERRRRVLLMAKRDNIPQAEIAHILGITAKAVERLLARTLQSLRDKSIYL